MQIVTYPHPTLRYRAKPVRRVDQSLRETVRDMFRLMYEANGIGLAATQVDLPMRLFVVNLSGKPDEGEEFAFLNPVVSHPKGRDEQEEGCLSLPGLYATVRRPAAIRLNAYTLAGEEIDTPLEGLLARVVQHETDHLDGVLFIDRLSETQGFKVQEEVERFEREYEQAQLRQVIPPHQEILARLAGIEAQYC